MFRENIQGDISSKRYKRRTQPREFFCRRFGIFVMKFLTALRPALVLAISVKSDII